MLPLQGAEILSLVEDLRSLNPHTQPKKKKKKKILPDEYSI